MIIDITEIDKCIINKNKKFHQFDETSYFYCLYHRIIPLFSYSYFLMGTDILHFSFMFIPVKYFSSKGIHSSKKRFAI